MVRFKKDTTIEDLVELFPGAIPLLSKFGIRCLICGEPSWGTIEEAASEKGITGEKLYEILKIISTEYEKSTRDSSNCGKP